MRHTNNSIVSITLMNIKLCKLAYFNGYNVEELIVMYHVDTISIESD